MPLQARAPIPAGTPVVLYWRDVAPNGLYATSWSGELYKVPVINFGAGELGVQSPDGSRIAIGTTVFDTTSASATNLPAAFATNTSITWADDSRHLCLDTRLGGPGSPSEVSYGMAGSSFVSLGKFGRWDVQVPGATVLACSATTHRVVVANVGWLNDTSDVWVVDTATGASQNHRSYATSTKTNDNIGTFVVASPSADYLAETDALTGSATIRRVADGAVMAQLQQVQVHGFSSSGHRVLVSPRPANLALDNTSTMQPNIVDWTTGRTVWQSPIGAVFGGRLAAQPTGDGIAIDLATSGRVWEIWLIGSNGKGRSVDQNIGFLVTELVGLV